MKGKKDKSKYWHGIAQANGSEHKLVTRNNNYNNNDNAKLLHGSMPDSSRALILSFVPHESTKKV